jgi:hypothetical protein
VRLGDLGAGRELLLRVQIRVAVHPIGYISRKCLTRLLFHHTSILGCMDRHMGLAIRRRICILRTMDTQQIIARLSTTNRAVVSRETGIGYTYLNRLVWGHIKDPGASKIDKLRQYFESKPLQ